MSCLGSKSRGLEKGSSHQDEYETDQFPRPPQNQLTNSQALYRKYFFTKQNGDQQNGHRSVV